MLKNKFNGAVSQHYKKNEWQDNLTKNMGWQFEVIYTPTCCPIETFSNHKKLIYFESNQLF